MISIIDFLFSLILLLTINNLNIFDFKEVYDQKLDNLRLLNGELQYFEKVNCKETNNSNFQVLKYKKFLKENETLILNEICFKKN